MSSMTSGPGGATAAWRVELGDGGDSHASHHDDTPDAGDTSPDDAPDAGGREVGPTRDAGPMLVLFDNTKGEQAGNADWVAFPGGRFASPVHPTRESEWRGGMSSWGYELHRTGRYDIEQLPPRARITFGDDTNAQDLSRYRVFVVPEPNNSFTATEADAIVAFVRAGGGLFIIADHIGADRDNDGTDAVEAWNGLFDATGDPFGIRFDRNDITDSPDANVLEDPTAPVLHGSFGHVIGTTYYNGATMTLSTSANASVRGLIWKSRAAQSSTQVTFAIATLDAGRVAAIGDSSPADDGTGTGSLHDGWNDPKGSNRELFLNATDWLARATP